MKRFLLLLVCMLLPAVSQGEWFCFRPEAVPPALERGAMQVVEGNCSVKLSFMGDCTLGGERRYRNAARGFVKTCEKNGYGWFFGGVSSLLKEDDLTLVNLEGVLSDRELTPVEKEFNFQGWSDYTNILLEGSVDCVTLSNNHTMDYGEEGYRDTLAALENAGIAFVDTNQLAIWEQGGIRVGFTASAFSPSQEEKQQLAENIALLRELGCTALVHSMHCGKEYGETPTAVQREMAAFLAEQGVDVVVGHHPHVVQGLERQGDTWILYSLGNGVFGGNSAPKDRDALLAQVTFTFVDGEREETQLELYPICVSSAEGYNDYRPCLLTGKDAKRVFEKMKASTGVDAEEYAGEGTGL